MQHENDEQHAKRPDDVYVPSSLLPNILQNLGLHTGQKPMVHVADLIADLHHHEWYVRASAVRELGKLSAQFSLELGPLLRALDDPHVSVRANAVWALGLQGKHIPLDRLEQALHDSEWQVRETTVRTLATLGQRTPVASLLTALHDSDSVVREAARLALQQTYPEVLIESTPTSLLANIVQAPNHHRTFDSLIINSWNVLRLGFWGEHMKGNTMQDANLSSPVNPCNRRTFPRHLGVIAAVVVMTLLVGSMLVVFNAARLHKMGTGVGSTLTGSVPQSGGQPKQVIYQSGSHKSVKYLTWSPDGIRMTAVIEDGSEDIGTLQSWDVTSGNNVLKYEVPNNTRDAPITGIAWSPDGKSLVAVQGMSLYVFDAKTALLETSLSAPGYPLSLQASASGLTASIGLHAMAEATLFSSTLSLSGGAPGLLSPSWSPDGQFLAVVHSEYSHSSFVSTLYVWNMTTGKLVESLNASNVMHYVKWAPHGKFLVTQSQIPSQSGSTNVMQIWDTTTWNMVQQYPNVRDFSWSPDGQRAALVDESRGRSRDVRIVNVLTGQNIQQFAQGEQFINDIEWSPDGSRIAVSSPAQPKSTQLWSLANGKLLSTFIEGWIYSGTWSPNSKYIADIVLAKAPSGKIPFPYQVQVWVAK